MQTVAQRGLFAPQRRICGLRHDAGCLRVQVATTVTLESRPNTTNAALSLHTRARLGSARTQVRPARPKHKRRAATLSGHCRHHDRTLSQHVFWNPGDSRARERESRARTLVSPSRGVFMCVRDDPSRRLTDHDTYPHSLKLFLRARLPLRACRVKTRERRKEPKFCKFE